MSVAVTTSGGVPTGSLIFLDGGMTLGTADLSASGTATWPVMDVKQGSHLFWAYYKGSSTMAPSASSTISMTVTAASSPAGTSTSLNITPNSAVSGGAVTMSVAVTAPGAVPSGSLLFLDGGATLGTGTLSSTGTASFTAAGLQAGTHLFWVYYMGSSTTVASASRTIPLTVTTTPAPTQTALVAAPTSTSLIAAPSAASAGQPVTLTANVGGATGGSLSFSDGSSVIGSATVSSAGQAVLVTSSLAQGTHMLSARYMGTTSSSGSTSTGVSVMVTAPVVPPTIACGAAPISINAGDMATVTASAASAANRALTVHFSTSTGTLAVNGSSAALSSAGAQPGAVTITCSVTDDLGQTASAATSVWVNAGQGEQALTAYNFTDSVGVNVHLHFGNTGYVTDFPDVLKSMVALGIHHYRNGVDPYAQPFEFANAEALAAAGIKGDWLIDRSDTAQNINAITASAPNSVDAFEGPNEDDIDAGAVLSNFAALLHDTVRANPSTANLPIYAPTLTQSSSITAQASVAAYVDYGNMHDYYYPRNPETPAYGGMLFGCGGYGTMAFNICVTGVISPGRPVVSTETGYISGTQSDVVYGRYLPRTLFAHLNANVMRTYVYELLDNVDSPGYGLVRGDFSPKPAYTAIQSLLTLFKDGSFATPGKLQYTLSGQTSNVQHTLLQKSDGTYMLAMWLGVPSASGVAPYQTYSIPSQSVDITMQTPVGSATVYALDDNGVMSSAAGSTSGSETTVSVTDRITIVAFSPRGN